jgi:hypothetical protein
MGGMFSVVKVRRGQKRNDYSDPGWFKHPPGTVAYEYQGETPAPVRAQTTGGQSMPFATTPTEETIVKVRKPVGHAGH